MEEKLHFKMAPCMIEKSVSDVPATPFFAALCASAHGYSTPVDTLHALLLVRETDTLGWTERPKRLSGCDLCEGDALCPPEVAPVGMAANNAMAADGTSMPNLSVGANCHLAKPSLPLKGRDASLGTLVSTYRTLLWSALD